MVKLIKVVAGIVLLVVVAVIIFLATLDLNRHKEKISQIIEDATGRQLRINGDLHLALSLTPTLVMENASLSNASWGAQPEMVSLDKFEVEVELRPFLSGDIQVNRIILLTPTILLETNEQGVGNWVFASNDGTEDKPADKKDLPSLLFSEILIKDAVINYKDGVTDEAYKVAIDELTEQTANADAPLILALKLIYEGIPVSLNGEFGSLNQLFADKPYPINLDVLTNQTKLSINGQITKPMAGRGFNLATQFDAESLDDIAQLIGSELPELQAINLSATLTDNNDMYWIKTLKFNVGDMALSGDISAKLSGKTPAIDLKLYSNKLDLTQFIPESTEQVEIELAPESEEQAKVTATEQMEQPQESLSIPALPFDEIKQRLLLVDANVDVSVKELITYGATFADTSVMATLKTGNLSVKPSTTIVEQGQLSADITFNSDKSEANAVLNAELDSIAKLSTLLGTTLPELGKLKVTAEVIADKQHYAVNNMNLNIGSSDLSGEFAAQIGGQRPVVTALLTSNMIDVNQLMISPSEKELSTGTAKSAESSSEGFSLEELKKKLLLLDGNVALSAKEIKTGSSTLTDTNIKVYLQSGDLKVEQLDGTIDGGQVKAGLTFISSATRPKLDIRLGVDSLAKLSKIAGTDLPALSPVKLTGNINFDKGNYLIDSLILQAGKTDLSGSASINMANKVPSIKATLSANLIDLTMFESKEKVKSDKKKTKNERIFSEEPLDLQALRSFNADVSLKAQKIKTSSLDIAKTNIAVSLNGGKLLVKPLQSFLAGGELSGTVGLNAAKEVAVLSSDLTMKGLQPNQLAELTDTLTGAKTDIDINLSGQGKSVSQIMAGLNGQFTVKVEDGVLVDSVMGALGADVLAKLAGMLNPFSKRESNTALKCAVVNFTIKDGIATAKNGIAISMDKLNILGDGDINLKNEKLDISLKAEPKEGLGISASKFVSLVKLAGTLANPSPSADLGGALSTGASVGTAVATGGLSLLAEGLLDRVTADVDPCATALGIRPSKRNKPAELPAATPSIDAVEVGGE